MPKIPRSVSPQEAVTLFACALQADPRPVPVGAELQRDDFEDLVMWGLGIVHPQTIKGYLRMGRAAGYWSVEDGAGRRPGRVTFQGVPEHRVPEALVTHLGGWPPVPLVET